MRSRRTTPAFAVVWRANSPRGHAADLGQTLRRVDDAGRLIGPLAAERLGGEVGGIGLDEDAIGGNAGGDGPQVVRLLERDHAGEADVQAQREKLGGLVGGAGERVHHAAQRSALAGLAEHRQNFGRPSRGGE